MNVTPLRFPDTASIKAALARFDSASAYADLIPALVALGFDFDLAHFDDDYWRDTVIRPDGTRISRVAAVGPRDRMARRPGQLMDRIEAIDGELGLPLGWFFLMTHGHWVEPDIGHAIAEGLKAQRIRLPDPDAAALLRWAERTYGF